MTQTRLGFELLYFEICLQFDFCYLGFKRINILNISLLIHSTELCYKLIAPHIGASQSNFSSSANVVSNLSANWAGMGAARRIFKSA